ncbi:hypothetical protein L210DRAFT_97222 [Boletus edulis BED1]|uniref:Uncharacterized protein n=1 Tax=Boletus edulis BED1 TaxID=1328754 RepID=A0AAD4BB58_BOLED|nr:hypothetical protein L210DRAFT_97222 [Boletus edulis BED1]
MYAPVSLLCVVDLSGGPMTWTSSRNLTVCRRGVTERLRPSELSSSGAANRRSSSPVRSSCDPLSNGWLASPFSASLSFCFEFCENIASSFHPWTWPLNTLPALRVYQSTCPRGVSLTPRD